MKRYINRLGQGIRETVDEFDMSKRGQSPKYIRAMLAEYRLSDSSARYWISTRCCKDWTK